MVRHRGLNLGGVPSKVAGWLWAAGDRSIKPEIALREPGILDQFTMPASRISARHERDWVYMALVGSDQKRLHLSVPPKPGAGQPAVWCCGSLRGCYGRHTLLQRCTE